MRAPKLQTNEYYWDPPDKKWLWLHYVELDKTGREIADEVDADVPIRPGHVRPSRGYSSRQARDRAMFKLRSSGVPRKCVRCDATECKLDVHHRDKDPFNEDLENLEFLCHSCHMALHKGDDAE